VVPPFELSETMLRMRETISNGLGHRSIAGGPPMDIEPKVHPFPGLRRFLKLLSDIDTGDLALVQVANEGRVESHLPLDIP
jgi:hypothetical protein